MPGALLILIGATFALPAQSLPAQSLPAQVAPLEIVSLVVEGTGNGHGRGLSQWGAYGRAVNGGHSWTQILDAYYGGTTLGTVATSSRIRVRLLAHDGDDTVGVISTTATAMWGSTGYAALQARATATANRYDIWAMSTAACPAATTTGWTLVAAGVAGPITFTTSLNEVTSPAGSVLGLCANDGSVTHYRGEIQLTVDSSGARRVVNDVPVESYLRGVVPREVSTSWGNAGGGAGINALRAQAVAARSYGLSQNRYAGVGGYATTCDTQTCQVYGGAARRPARRRGRRPTACARPETSPSSVPTPTGRSPSPPVASAGRRAERSCRPSSRRRTGRRPPVARSRRSAIPTTTCRRTPTTGGRAPSTTISLPPPTDSAR